MHKVPVYGLVGLTAFGVTYDAGLFGTPDGHDHSAVISVAATAASTGLPNTVIVFNNVTGENVVVVPPEVGSVGNLKP